MVNRGWIMYALFAGIVGLSAWQSSPAGAQTISKGIFDCGAAHCAAMEAGPSFSDISARITAGAQRVEDDTGEGFRATGEFTAKLPFRSSPYGPNVTASGLGATRSIEGRLTLVRVPRFDPDASDETDHAVFGLEIMGALGHRRMNSAGPDPAERVSRYSHAIGLSASWIPPEKSSGSGMKFGAGVEYRKQFLPDALSGTPVKVKNLVLRSSVTGGIGPKRSILRNGLRWDITAAYDVERDVPGIQLGLATLVSAHPRLVVGIRSWIQGRDRDSRTQDKTWDVAPQVSVNF